MSAKKPSPEEVEARRASYREKYRENIELSREAARASYHRNKENRRKMALGYIAEDREGHNAKRRARYAKDPEKARAKAAEAPSRTREYRRFKIRGMDPAEQAALFQSQDGKCAICSKTEEQSGRPHHLDHCHKTGRIRAFLCGHCNSGIGQLRDDPELVEKALKYLRDHE